MAGRLTVWGAGQLLTTYFGVTAEPPPAFYLALIREVPPTPYMDGTELDEPENEDYARVEILNDMDSWANDAQPQEVYNIGAVEYVTSTSEWGKVNYWALCNAVVDGYPFIIGELENPVLVAEGDQVRFEEGDLSVSLGPFYLVEEA